MRGWFRARAAEAGQGLPRGNATLCALVHCVHCSSSNTSRAVVERKLVLGEECVHVTRCGSLPIPCPTIIHSTLPLLMLASCLTLPQDDAFTRLDLQHLVDARTAARAAAAKAAAAAQEGRQHEGAGVGGHERQQQQQPDPVELQTLVALAPPSQRMRVFAVGEAGDGASGVSSVEGQQAGTGDGAGGVGGADGVHGRGLVVVAVTDTQELLVFRQPNAHVARGTG